MSASPGDGRWLRAAGAAAVIVGGALHVRLAADGYGTPDLISLFFLNGIASAVVGVWIAYARRPLAILAGLGISSVSLLALGLSRVGTGVVGFRGTGLDPVPDTALTIAAEGAALVLLGLAALRARHELLALGRQLRS